MPTETPLISCLCVTYKRADFLRRAIDCFRHQTYQSKELMILFQDDDKATIDIIDGIKDNNIHSLEVRSADNLTLGGKRNLSIEAGHGKYFCIWDDDDWYHPQRLEVQMDAIKNNHRDASVLTHLILYDCLKQQAYLSQPWPWEGTLLCKKDLVGALSSYRETDKGEDSWLLRDLIRNNHVFPVIKPILYIYNYTGLNTWGYNHFGGFFSRSQKLSAGSSALIKGILENKTGPGEASALLNNRELQKDLNYLFWATPVFDKILK